MIVVFDSNIWLAQLGLRSPAASAVRFFIKHNDYEVALPEVIRDEVQRNLERRLGAFIQALRIRIDNC